MTAPSIADVDPFGLAVAHLITHPRVTEVLGGPGRVNADNEPPYPRLRVTNPPGDDRSLRWVLGSRVVLDVLGDMDGTPSRATLRRILYTVLAALTELPDLDWPEGSAVVTDVRSSAGGGWLPEPTGQPRYTAEVMVYAHPPRVIVP